MTGDPRPEKAAAVLSVASVRAPANERPLIAVRTTAGEFRLTVEGATYLRGRLNHALAALPGMLR